MVLGKRKWQTSVSFSFLSWAMPMQAQTSVTTWALLKYYVSQSSSAFFFLFCFLFLFPSNSHMFCLPFPLKMEFDIFLYLLQSLMYFITEWILTNCRSENIIQKQVLSFLLLCCFFKFTWLFRCQLKLEILTILSY